MCDYIFRAVIQIILDWYQIFRGNIAPGNVRFSIFQLSAIDNEEFLSKYIKKIGKIFS